MFMIGRLCFFFSSLPTFTSMLYLQERRYICFDGDIDPVYVENLRPVMDDSKMLTLANGECIRLENHCAILFEVSSTIFIFRWKFMIVVHVFFYFLVQHFQNIYDIVEIATISSIHLFPLSINIYAPGLLV